MCEKDFHNNTEPEVEEDEIEEVAAPEPASKKKNKKKGKKAEPGWLTLRFCSDIHLVYFVTLSTCLVA